MFGGGRGAGGPLQGRAVVLHALHIPAPDIFTEYAASAQIRVRTSDIISRRFSKLCYKDNFRCVGAPEGLVEGVDVGPHLVLPVLVPYQPAQCTIQIQYILKACRN